MAQKVRTNAKARAKNSDLVQFEGVSTVETGMEAAETEGPSFQKAPERADEAKTETDH